MRFMPTSLPGSFIVELQPFEDERGWFTRFYCKDEFRQIGHTREWVQMNHSFTREKGSMRGMHFQLPPFREIKMVRCISGSVYDVIVDLRSGSPGFLKIFGAELSARNKKMMYIPEGFAHGFQVLEEDSELIYLHTEYYQPGSEGGIRYDDPRLGVVWPEAVATVSERDRSHPFLTENFKGI